jgi:hypothetical protein
MIAGLERGTDMRKLSDEQWNPSVYVRSEGLECLERAGL